MKEITIYTSSICPYCVKAKFLLQNKGVNFKEINVENDESLRAEMTKKAGGKRSVPQIFIGDFHVGGCDDLYELNNKGELDNLLS